MNELFRHRLNSHLYTKACEIKPPLVVCKYSSTDININMVI